MSMLTLAAILAAFAGPGQVPPQPAEPPEQAKPVEARSQWKGDPYLLDVDPVTRLKLGPVETQWKILYRGREFRFASKEISDKFQEEPAKYIPGVDARLVRDQSDFYPLETCLVTGEKLGDKTVSLIHKNRLVRFAGQEHVQTFLTDTEKYIAALDEAVIAKQTPKYAKKMCAVCGKAFDELAPPVDYVIGNRLIRLSPQECAKDIERDPRKYMEWYPEKENRTRSSGTPEGGEPPR